MTHNRSVEPAQVEAAQFEAAQFEAAARAFLELVTSIQPAQWDASGLGSWSVRDLVGHTSRAITTLDEYLRRPAPAEVTVANAESYFLRVFDGATDHRAVAARGIEAGEALGDDAATTISQALTRTLNLLVNQSPERLVEVVGGLSLPLTEYLRTRVFELVVHGLDLEKATRIKLRMPPAILADVTALTARVAAARGSGPELLFALTGRAPLPAGYSIF